MGKTTGLGGDGGKLPVFEIIKGDRSTVENSIMKSHLIFFVTKKRHNLYLFKYIVNQLSKLLIICVLCREMI